MADKHPIRTRVIAAVVSGLVLAGIKWFLPTAWASGRIALREIGAWLQTSVSLPRWLALAAALAVGSIMVFMWRARSRQSDGKSEGDVADVIERMNALPTLSELPALQRAILQSLVDRDGDLVDVESLRRQLGVKRLTIDSAVDALANLDIKWVDAGSFSTTKVSLTPRGRDYAIAQNLLA